VLVVDDEPTIREITQLTLESFGFRVLTADGGAEALSLYAQHQAEIAIVLTDMMMPGMDGFEVIRHLLEINPLAKIIAASGLAAPDTVAKATSAGVSHFLQKPYTAEALLRICAEIREEKHDMKP
jgi:CheY-like chemotaxis protein